MPMEVTWYSESDIEGSVDEFLKKYDEGSLTGEDFPLFEKAMVEAGKLSQESDDDMKQEFAEIMEDDLEEYESLAYAIEVRDKGIKLIQLMSEDEQKLGSFEGDFDENDPVFEGYKHVVFMEATPETWLQCMKGNPNTDAQFFSGELTVKGPIKLASKPREWIYAFFEFIDREVE